MAEVEIIKILLVDDDEVDRMAVQRALKFASFPVQITEAENCADALSLLNTETFDCALLDYRLPDCNGLELVTQIRDRNIQIPLIVLTGQSDDQIAVELLKEGASDYLAKSKVSPGRLAQVLQNALRVHKAETAAAITNQHREELLKQREDFISRLTHDLQTPLFAANRMLQFFQDSVFGELPPGVAQRIPVIIRSNHNLLQMVNNIVEVYSHETEEKYLHFDPCDVQDVLEEVVQELLPLAIIKNIDLNLKVQDQGYYKVLGDFLELRRVFINLIGNSIKFTDVGQIQVGLSNSNEHPKTIVVTVQDTGSGIAQELQGSLFERFRSGNHKRSNTGLGLYLSRRILELHQGSISLHSELGVGSTFTIHLPQH
ncbi:MAG: hybrid sensor histidine kinase/response regulator [Thermosynechococcaceae cyanobacterium]